MKALKFLVVITISLAGCSSGDQPATEPGSASAPQVADTVYTNGKIYTVNDAQSWAEAVAIKDGEFIVVGSSDDVGAVSGDGTEVVDLGGAFVMPGLHDTHVHLEQSYKGDMLGDALLTFPAGEGSIPKLQEIMKEYADKNPDLSVLFAQNMPQAPFPNASPTMSFIDDVVPDRPFVMLSDTEHDGLLNKSALEMEGITRDTETPAGGTIVKDSDTGEPTGLFRETAAGKWAWKHYPEVSAEQHKRGLAGTIAYLNSLGITSVKQQHAKSPIAFAAQSLEQDGVLNARIALSWTWKGPLEPSPVEEQEATIAERGQFASDLIKTEFVKLSIDGTAGTTGYVVDPYVQTGDRGLPVFPNDDDVYAEVERFDRMGLSITAHASGDAAIRQVIDAIDRVNEKYGEVKGRHQLGHATLIHPDDIPRLSELDITPEFSPLMWYPMPFVDAQRAQLGEDRMNRWYPIKSVDEAGGRVALGSDGPLFWHEPLQNLEAAVTRQTPGGSEDAVAPHEAIDLATAIKAMTLNSAYLMNQDDAVGSIEVGKRADMVVLDKNLFDLESTSISSAEVLKTVFDGRVVYDAAVSPGVEDTMSDDSKR